MVQGRPLEGKQQQAPGILVAGERDESRSATAGRGAQHESGGGTGAGGFLATYLK